MSYFESIAWLLSWPLLIIVVFQLIRYLLKKNKVLKDL
jgi:hypothetical protein